MCLPCLPNRRVSPCVLCAFMVGLMRNGGSVYVFFCMLSMVIVLWEVNAILGNGYEIQGQNYVPWLQGSEMPVGFH